MKHRHLSRQAALQILTSLLLNTEQDAAEVIKYIIKEFAPQINNPKLIEELVRGVLEHREQIDIKIFELAPQFPVEKLDPVERVILEIAIFEILHYDTPTAVAINEAVDLAKEFGDNTAGKFINGVLSSVASEVKNNEAKT